MPKKALETLTESMFYVLMAFSCAECCGIDVMNFVETQTGGALRLGPATLYTILAKFQEAGYLVQTSVSGRKRTYAITAAGRSAYQEELDRLRRCVAHAEQAALLEYRSLPQLKGGSADENHMESRPLPDV